ncbi:MAG: hypothetical protein DMG27_23985, partial [Acidobacteria bacterium]
SETLFANEGSGANQLPFILLPIALAPTNETILLSEPEVHLHPKAQSELTALLLRAAEKQNLQLFIETHSEHVLHELLHAVAKGELARDDLAIYYFANHPKREWRRLTAWRLTNEGESKGACRAFTTKVSRNSQTILTPSRKPSA